MKALLGVACLSAVNGSLVRKQPLTHSAPGHSEPLHVAAHAEFSALTAAFQDNDVARALAVSEKVTRRLRHEAALRGIVLPASSTGDDAPVSSSSGAPATKGMEGVTAMSVQSRVVGAHRAQKLGCVLDDALFALTDASKADLWQELGDPAMQDALKWVKTGGWWHCASWSQMCECHGFVRMVDWDRTASSSMNVDARATGNRVMCDVATFGGVDVGPPGSAKVCECSHSPGGEDFHLHKRLGSKSYLQEAWIFLLRLLGRTSLLPAGTGDKTYHGMENWSARHAAWSTPLPIEPRWIEMFVKKVVQPSTTGLSRCLEWGNPATPGKGFNYLFMMPQCTDKVDLQFDAVHSGQKAVGTVEGNVIYSDIVHLPHVVSYGGDHRLGIIFSTQVFEHLADPKGSCKSLFESLLPGGALVFTAPQQAQFHKVPNDYFRYTKQGALQVLQEAGFCVPAWGFAGGGDFVFDIARDAGLQVQDFPMDEVTGSYQQGYDLVSDSAITIHALAFKPPHAVCNQVLPPIA